MKKILPQPTNGYVCGHIVKFLGIEINGDYQYAIWVGGAIGTYSDGEDTYKPYFLHYTMVDVYYKYKKNYKISHY